LQSPLFPCLQSPARLVKLRLQIVSERASMVYAKSYDYLMLFVLGHPKQ